jgi:response regulator RpfG family c-di-GMP phosphodiesterase
VEIIKKDSGTHFDPKIVEAFLNVCDDFWAESMIIDNWRGKVVEEI